MSAEIHNREYRQQVLKELISQLHDGKSVEEVKGRFAAVFGDVSAEEIAQAREKANQTLNATLSQLLAAFHILDLQHFGPILFNIVSKGLPEIQKELLFKKENANVRSL